MELDIDGTVRGILSSQKEKISRMVMEKVKADIAQALAWGVQSSLKEEVAAFYEAELKPEVSRLLSENREAIVQSIAMGLAGAGAELVKQLTAQAAKNLDSSWNLKEIADKLFR